MCCSVRPYKEDNCYLALYLTVRIAIWHCISNAIWHCISSEKCDLTLYPKNCGLTLYSHEIVWFDTVFSWNHTIWHCISQDINAIWHCISWAKCDLTLYFMRIQCQITTIVFVIWHCILKTRYSVKSQYMPAIQWQIATNRPKYSAKSHFGRSNTVSNHRVLFYFLAEWSQYASEPAISPNHYDHDKPNGSNHVVPNTSEPAISLNHSNHNMSGFHH